jgi:DNA-binding protein
MQAAEDLTAKLSMYSLNAQLHGFTEKTKDIMVAAREQRIAKVINLAEELKLTFEQMLNSTNTSEIEQRLKFEACESSCSK